MGQNFMDRQSIVSVMLLCEKICCGILYNLLTKKVRRFKRNSTTFAFVKKNKNIKKTFLTSLMFWHVWGLVLSIHCDTYT